MPARQVCAQVPQITVSPEEISSQTSGATSCPRSGPGSSGTPSLVHPLAQPHLCRPPRTARRPHRQQEVQLVRRGVPSEEGLQHLVQGLCGLVVEGLCGGGGGQAAGRPQWVAQSGAEGRDLRGAECLGLSGLVGPTFCRRPGPGCLPESSQGPGRASSVSLSGR